MKNVFHKKGWNVDINSAHVEPLPITLVKEISTGKSYGDYVKLEFHRDPTSSTSNLYELLMYLFYHGELEEFLLFVQNFQMTLSATVTLETESRVQYLCKLVCGEALRQFELLYVDKKNIGTH